ncbi:MAG: hypothetical protein AAGF98_03890 [Cyanobacteria bacterium P01_H01_bin.153]
MAFVNILRAVPAIIISSLVAIKAPVALAQVELTAEQLLQEGLAIASTQPEIAAAKLEEALSQFEASNDWVKQNEVPLI